MQAPLISCPAKSTTEVDLATPVRSVIQSTYGENPQDYAEQTSTLTRARQDAVRGAGGDAVARDLLYKWFHMLEMLELRFPGLRVPFPWKDAFTQKSISQHSLAYEKASIIFNIGSVLSNLGSSQTRTSGNSEGLKRAYTCFRQAGGMFSYINDNFLHAPSTDMSREVVKCLVAIMMAQASEVFLEKSIEEKKGNTLVSKLASHTASMYGTLAEDIKEWTNKGIFERSWQLLIAAKAKHFASITQYYRALADDASGSHGACLVRVTLAESLSKEAQRLASTFASFLSGSLSPVATLPADAGAALSSVCSTQLTLCTERKTAAIKDNDLIYHDILPSESTLPAVDKLVAATPVSIQEVYATPEVQKVIGPDLFSRLVPLGVHESASLYSEEKAKVARAETERNDLADGELNAALEYMGLPHSLEKYRDLGKGGPNTATERLADPGREVMDWADEEARGGGSRGADGLGEGTDGVQSALQRISSLKRKATQDLDELSAALDEDNRACEKNRVRFEHKWTQEPAGTRAKAMRAEIKENREVLRRADDNDTQIAALWEEIRPDVELLVKGRSALEGAFAVAITSSGPRTGGKNAASLLDVDDEAEAAQTQVDGEEAAKVRASVERIDAQLEKLRKLKKERGNVLSSLKEAIQTDDISQVLVLNRRSANVEPAIFKQELEKFKPHLQRLGLCISQQETTLQEISREVKTIEESPAARQAARQWDAMKTRRDALVNRLRDAKERHAEVRASAAKGTQFYADLGDNVAALRHAVNTFVGERRSEREKLVGELEWDERLNGSGGGQASSESNSRPSMQSADSITNSMASMHFQHQPPPPPLPGASSYASPPPRTSSYTTSPPPPVTSPYDNMFGSSTLPPSFSGASSFASPPPSSPYSAAPSHPPYGAAPPSLSDRAPSLPPPPPQFQSAFSPTTQPAAPYSGYSNSHGSGTTYQQAPPPPQQSAYAAQPPPPPPPSQGYYTQQAYAPPQHQQAQSPVQYGAHQSPYSPYGAQQPPPPPPPQQQQQQQGWRPSY